MQTALCILALIGCAAAAAVSNNSPVPWPGVPSAATEPTTTRKPFVWPSPRPTIPAETTTTYTPIFDPTHTDCRIRLESYRNEEHLLSNGQECDRFWGGGGCDTKFNVLYTSTHDGHVYNIDTNQYGDQTQVQFGLQIPFRNPITLRAPAGAAIEVQVTALDVDFFGTDLIGQYSFFVVVGAGASRETKTDIGGHSSFTLSFTC